MDAKDTKILRERGVRITPQRALIWHTLVTSGQHFTADELWERVKGDLPGLELSTIYRSLEALSEVGLVVESRLPEGPRVFEARGAPHPHLVCEGCGAISHLDQEATERLRKILGTEIEGFRPQQLHVLATGICADCAAADTSDIATTSP